MTFAARLAARQAVNLCPIAAAAGQLDPGERAAFFGLIDLRGKDGKYALRDRRVSDDIKGEGIDIREAAVRDHRAGTCGCKASA